MLSLKHISKSFGSKIVFKDLSVTIHPGDFIIIVGPNGSGKSSLFNIIAGKLSVDKGAILMNTHDITRTNEIERSQWVSRLFQDPKTNVIGDMTVAENIALALTKQKRVHLRHWHNTHFMNTIKNMNTVYNIDLEPFLEKKMASLSGGQRQLIAFIMATITKPKVLLLDEPTAALDPMAATTLLTCAHRFIAEHNTTTILITHDPQLALTLGAKLWIINKGKLRVFNEHEKQALTPADLIGKIDYAKIKS